MTTNLILTGDVNLMNVSDAMVPFALVRDEFHAADIVFCNLECCLYRPPDGHAVEHEGFFADPRVAGEALRSAGVQAIGLANNVNYGEAAIMASIARLDELGIAHTGAGANRALARAPAILSRDGVRFGFVQRSSVYWPTNHEAGEDTPGIAVIRGHTAYHVPMHGSRPPANRPGIPPEIVTWADPRYLRWLDEDIAALHSQADVVIASFHWGLHKEVLQYMPFCARSLTRVRPSTRSRSTAPAVAPGSRREATRSSSTCGLDAERPVADLERSLIRAVSNR